MSHMRHIIVAPFMIIGLCVHSASALDRATQPTRIEALSEHGFCKRQLHGEILARTELFFGLSKSDGSEVTEKEFQYFIATEVTPRFPAGLTVFTGQGQFKNSTGKISKEGAKLLIVLYPFNNKSHKAIEEIRGAYKATFQQESVLRVDAQSCVSF